MLTEALDMCARGLAVHWLHPRSKRPVGKGWETRPFPTVGQLERTYRDGMNVGFRPGQWSKVQGAYVHVIDLDIRDEARAGEAYDALADVFPELDVNTAPTVISGSGGASRHFFFFTDKAFSKRVIAKSADKDESRRHVWQIELYGGAGNSANNLVLPPSIHPETGVAYRWVKQFDWDDIELFGPTIIPSAAVERAGGYQDVDADDVVQEPIGLTADEVADYLSDYPNTDLDYDEWLEVATAVQHECMGRSDEEKEQFFNVFLKWSRQSNKHDDSVAKTKFFSFKNPSDRLLKTFRYVRSMVNDIRIDRQLEDEFGEMDDQDDLGDFDDQNDEDEGDDESDLDTELAKMNPEVEDDDWLFGSMVPRTTPMSPNQERKANKRKKVETEAALGRDAPKWVQRLNEKHAVARVQGKTLIIDFKYDGTVAYGSSNDLHIFYENKRMNNDDGKSVAITRVWLQNHYRRSYPNGIVFLPNKVVPGAFNHWQGFSVEPANSGKKAFEGCKMFLKHLREVICSDNEEHFQYALKYWAHMIQKPEDKPGVAFVVRGKKGAGKDTIAEYMGKLIERHYITIGNQEQLTSKFNRFEERCLLLHVQEGFWAGSKKDESALKYKITSPDVYIEPKGVDAFQVKSVLRIFISSNERWVVPASEDERRYFVLNVSDCRRRDHEYFSKLRDEMEGDGPACLLAYLQSLDLKGFQVRDVPDTDALAEQKLQGLKNVERWWQEVLQHGQFDGVVASIWNRGAVSVPKEDFLDVYGRWMRHRRYDGEEVSEVEFGRRIKAMLPTLGRSRVRVQGRGRSSVYKIPRLDECRKMFETYIGSEVLWPEEQIEEVDDSDMEDDLG